MLKHQEAKHFTGWWSHAERVPTHSGFPVPAVPRNFPLHFIAFFAFSLNSPEWKNLFSACFVYILAQVTF
jgi:hypothetical protein